MRISLTYLKKQYVQSSANFLSSSVTDENAISYILFSDFVDDVMLSHNWSNRLYKNIITFQRIRQESALKKKLLHQIPSCIATSSPVPPPVENVRNLCLFVRCCQTG